MVEIILETNTKLYMEEFFKQVEFIRANVEQIVNCVGDVRRLHIAMLTDLSGENSIRFFFKHRWNVVFVLMNE